MAQGDANTSVYDRKAWKDCRRGKAQRGSVLIEYGLYLLVALIAVVGLYAYFNSNSVGEQTNQLGQDLTSLAGKVKSSYSYPLISTWPLTVALNIELSIVDCGSDCTTTAIDETNAYGGNFASSSKSRTGPSMLQVATLYVFCSALASSPSAPNNPNGVIVNFPAT